MQCAVKSVDENKIDRRIHKSPEHNVNGLLFETFSMCIQKKRTHARNARPVGRKRYKADHRNQNDFRPERHFFVTAKCDQNHSPGKRPHYAGLIKSPSLERNKRNPECKVVCKMRNQRKHKKSRRIFFYVVRAVASLGNKKPHNRRGQPSNHMQRKNIPDRLKSRKQNPSQMVNRHCNYRNQFYVIRVQFFMRVRHTIRQDFSRFLKSEEVHRRRLGRTVGFCFFQVQRQWLRRKDGGGKSGLCAWHHKSRQLQ